MFDARLTLIIESRIDQITPLARAVRGVCSCVVEDEVLLYQLELCAVEAVTNVINHAYHRDPHHFVTIDTLINEKEIIIHVKDSGKKSPRVIPKSELEFNPLEISTLPESGMGLFLIHKIMDGVSYSDDQEQNVIIMRKSLVKS